MNDKEIEKKISKALDDLRNEQNEKLNGLKNDLSSVKNAQYQTDEKVKEIRKKVMELKGELSELKSELESEKWRDTLLRKAGGDPSRE